MRLQERFKKVFILPLISGVIFSILFSIITMIIFENNFALVNEFFNDIVLVENLKIEPLIEITKSMMYSKIQGSIDILIIMRNYYKFYAEELNVSNNIELIKNYSFNPYEIYNNTTLINQINENLMGKYHYNIKTIVCGLSIRM